MYIGDQNRVSPCYNAQSKKEKKFYKPFHVLTLEYPRARIGGVPRIVNSVENLSGVGGWAARALQFNTLRTSSGWTLIK